MLPLLLGLAAAAGPAPSLPPLASGDGIAAVVAGASGVWSLGAPSARPRPRLSSVFVSLAVRPDWNASRWATLVGDLKAIQVDNIILADSVTESEAWYPSKIPGLTHASADVVGMALEAAQKGGLTVYAGMLLPANWFHHGAMNATYLRQLTARENAVASELHSLYGEAYKGTLAGFYHAAEVYSTCCFSKTQRCDAAHVQALASMLEPTGQLIHSLGPYDYVIAPFAKNVSALETTWWASLLQLTPSVDIVAFQDGVGVSAGTRSPQAASELIKAVSAAVSQQKNMSMWTDIEIFSHPTYSVAPTKRFLSQLELEAQHVSGVTIWEFTAYMDPHGCSESKRADCLRLYNDYRRYLAGGRPA